MKISSILIMGFLIIAILVGVTGYVSLYQINKISEPFSDGMPLTIEELAKTSQLDGLAEFIRYYDEVLTQSARNYAFTQNKKWEQRYKEVEPKLDVIIKEAIAKGDEKDKEFFSSVDVANIALVEMEYKSIKLVNENKALDAVNILESAEYWNQKEIYEKGLRDYVSRRGAEYDEALSTSTETLDLATKKVNKLIEFSRQLIFILSISAFLISILLGIILSYFISKPIRTLTNALNEISKGNFKVKINKESFITEVQNLADSLYRILASLKLAVLKVGVKREELVSKKVKKEEVEEKVKEEPIKKKIKKRK